MNDIDVVFIDGRYRVLTVLVTFNATRDDTIYICHDFANRPFYGTILEFFDLVER